MRSPDLAWSGLEVRGAKSPATSSLCQVGNKIPLLRQKGKKEFHSDLAKLLFLAKRVRMQCITAVSVLAGRINVATEADQGRSVSDAARKLMALLILMQAGPPTMMAMAAPELRVCWMTVPWRGGRQSRRW